jgi:hypothetical protein
VRIDAVVVLDDEVAQFLRLDRQRAGDAEPPSEQRVLEDPCGHQWSIGTHVRDPSPEEMQKAMEQMGS